MQSAALAVQRYQLEVVPRSFRGRWTQAPLHEIRAFEVEVVQPGTCTQHRPLYLVQRKTQRCPIQVGQARSQQCATRVVQPHPQVLKPDYLRSWLLQAPRWFLTGPPSPVQARGRGLSPEALQESLGGQSFPANARRQCGPPHSDASRSLLQSAQVHRPLPTAKRVTKPHKPGDDPCYRVGRSPARRLPL